MFSQPLEEEDDWELQQALALSLQEAAAGSPPPPAEPVAGPSSTGSKPGAKREQSSAPPKGQKRRKKGCSFNPSEAELKACFAELDGGGKAHITVQDLEKVGRKC